MENKKTNSLKKIISISVIIGTFFGGLSGGIVSSLYFQYQTKNKENKIINTNTETVSVTEEESAVVSAVEKVSPAVVNVVSSKDLPKIQRFRNPFFDDEFFREFFGDDFSTPDNSQNGETERKEISSGTGFIVSKDGYIVTNKHVVSSDDADYTVLMNNEEKYDAKVIARDPINDLAILKIEAENLPFVELGDSSNLKVGQKTIAIGNALGEFSNTVSTGVISGLSRSIIASGGSIGTEELIDVIQTDASINPGNSGGPLLDISGRVIGINTAIASGAQNIGFAIPINEVKSIIESVEKYGKIVRPWIGVRYVQINETIKKENNLDINYGALILRGEKISDLAIVPGSPADKAGLTENDIILEINGIKIDSDNPLNRAIAKFKPDDEITLKVLHKGEEKEVKVKLEERKE
ncbi:MAG: trypsin-like peptidase domain-containing protein [Patescibacteria group bacterium]|nr:trypsin-like peptidase domain-containing protein [Patescibacteria group bacterium]